MLMAGSSRATWRVIPATICASTAFSTALPVAMLPAAAKISHFGLFT